MNTIEFEVHNRTITRVDSKGIVTRNKQTYQAVFIFEENSEWTDLNKFVIFTDGWDNVSTQHIGTGNVLSCLIPDDILDGSYFKVSVYGGDLFTTNNVTISLIQSGYNTQPTRPNNSYGGCSNKTQNDIFREIFEDLDKCVDSIVYDNKTLRLFNRDTVLDSIHLPFLTDDEIYELVDELTEQFIIPLATTESDGLMSSEDKLKLDSVESGANRIVVDTVLDDSDNPLANRVIKNNFDNIRSIVDEHGNRIDGLDDSLETIRVNLNGKEDSYDYVERLDNIIITLINQGE